MGREVVHQLAEAAAAQLQQRTGLGAPDPSSPSYSYTVLASENAKDIPFIVSLSGETVSGWPSGVGGLVAGPVGWVA